MAPTAGRGALMSLMQLMVAASIQSLEHQLTCLQYAIGSFMSSISLNIVSQDSPDRWRNAVLSQFALCGVAILAWVFLPESARWHLQHDREDKCKEILQKVNGKVEGYDVEKEYKRMRLELENAKVTASLQGGGTYWDVFRGVNRVSHATS